MTSSDNRGSVAVLKGLRAPVVIMSVPLEIEVASGSVGKVELQRIADVAAWAGATDYTESSNRTEAIADSNSPNGTSDLAANRSGCGMLSFRSLPGSSSVALVR